MSIGKNLNYVSEQKLIEYVKNPELAAAVNIPAAAALYELQNRVVLEKEAEALKNKEAMAQGSVIMGTRMLKQSILEYQAGLTVAGVQTTGFTATLYFKNSRICFCTCLKSSCYSFFRPTRPFIVVIHTYNCWL